jgi:hypothetical protein
MYCYGKPRWDGVKGEWMKLHNGELIDLYYPPNFRVITAKELHGRGI